MKEFFVPLGLSFVTGSLLGLEREMSHKPAGLRTQVLINLGATLFVLVVGKAAVGVDMANILTGLGFLGAGVIWQQKGNVRGLTTARSTFSF